MAEFQILTHEYGAEYGGASGVIVNAITKSGTNQLHGRGFYFLQDSKLNATNYFLKLEGEKNPDSGTKSMGGNIGGPIIRNKAFWFFNYEYTHSRDAVRLSFPAPAAPLATSFSDVYNVHLKNYFVRGDYQMNPSNTMHGSLIYGPNDGHGENAEAERYTKQGFRYELAAPEILANFSWTSILGNKIVNEVKVGTVQENLWIGDRSIFGESGKDVPWDLGSHQWTALNGLDPARRVDQPGRHRGAAPGQLPRIPRHPRQRPEGPGDQRHLEEHLAAERRQQQRVRHKEQPGQQAAEPLMIQPPIHV